MLKEGLQQGGTHRTRALAVDHAQLSRVFFPHITERSESAIAKGRRFAYYTTADVACKILRTEEIWMRNASIMNDFREIEHGVECLGIAYRSAEGEAFRCALDAVFPKLSDEIPSRFDELVAAIRGGTYLTCVSEHCGGEEDKRARLSMWRAYGGGSGVAIVINGQAMLAPSTALGVVAIPVLYGDADAMASQLAVVAERISANARFVESLGRDITKEFVLQMLSFIVLCTKHPGFHEELEWRVIAAPTLPVSDRVPASVEVVRGVPQLVRKMRLENVLDEGLSALAIPDLIDRIIIGPSEFPNVIYQALSELLSQRGVADPESRLVISDIPLRHLG